MIHRRLASSSKRVAAHSDLVESRRLKKILISTYTNNSSKMMQILVFNNSTISTPDTKIAPKVFASAW